MNKIKIYVSHSIRGKCGAAATLEQVAANNQRAIEFGKKIREAIPGVAFYIPGDHDEFVTIAYVEKYLTEDQILKIDCKIIDTCNLLINFMPDEYLSNGMRVENEHANRVKVPVFNVYSDNMNEAPIRVIKQYIIDLMRG